MRVTRWFSTALLLTLPLAVSAQQITVSAAASLTNAFRDIGTQFEAVHPGATVRFNFAASGVLLQQITQGAPVDVFVSADQATMDRAAAADLLQEGSRRDFVSNTLVLIEPVEGGAKLKTLDDLKEAAITRIAIGKTATVPVGRYTQEVLKANGIWDALQPKFVQADSVRQVLDYVSRGEADAGFVYRTDAAIMADKVKVVLTAPGATPVMYPVAVLKDSTQPQLAGQFEAFLFTPSAQAVLERYGFGKP